MSLLIQDQVVARYIVQVNIVHREGSINFLGSFNVWKKGGEFGRADHLLKFCSEGGCTGIVSDRFELTEHEIGEFKDPDDADNPESWPDSLKKRYATWFMSPTICPCGKSVCPRYDLPDSYGFNLPISRIAERAAQIFRALNSDADLFLVRTKEHNVFQKAQDAISGPAANFSKYRARLEKARDRENVFYPLKSIMKDVAAGGDLAKRFEALLGA